MLQSKNKITLKIILTCSLPLPFWVNVERITATHRTEKQWRHWHSRPEGYGRMMIPALVKCGWRLMGPWWGPSCRHTSAMPTPPLSARVSALVQMIDCPKARPQKLSGTPSSWYGGKCSFSSNGSQSIYLVLSQFSSVAQSCLTLCDPMDCSTPGLPVHHQLPEFTQTHLHWVNDAIQLSNLLSFPSPPAFNLSQH